MEQIKKDQYLRFLNTISDQVFGSDASEVQKFLHHNDLDISFVNEDDIKNIDRQYKFYNMVQDFIEKRNSALYYERPESMFVSYYKLCIRLKNSINFVDEKDVGENIELFRIKSDFSFTLSGAFRLYRRRWLRNDYNRYRRDSHGQRDITVFSDEEFQCRFGEPPWDLLNRILHRTGFLYEFESPNFLEMDEDYSAKLVEKGTNKEIRLLDLSSGEEVLLKLALSKYAIEEFSNYPAKFVKLWLLDEVDAVLHPSMISHFFDLLR